MGREPQGCNKPGPGAFRAQGMEGLDPANGTCTSPANRGLYTRARGLGADDMLVTTAGLWIASDNLDNASQCGGVRPDMPASASCPTLTDDERNGRPDARARSEPSARLGSSTWAGSAGAAAH